MSGRDLDLDRDGTISVEDISAVEKLAEIERQDPDQRDHRNLNRVAT